MPQLDISVVHNLGVAEAKTRVNLALAQAAFGGEFQVNWQWRQERIAEISMVMQGYSFAGSLTVSENTVNVIVELSFMAWFYKSRIEQEIRSRLQVALIRSFFPSAGDTNHAGNG